MMAGMRIANKRAIYQVLLMGIVAIFASLTLSVPSRAADSPRIGDISAFGTEKANFRIPMAWLLMRPEDIYTLLIPAIIK